MRSPAALALAIKTEACPYNEVPRFLEAAAKALGTDTGTLMANEMAFMTGIKFNLTLHHPYKALRGLMADMKERCGLKLTSAPDAAVQAVGTSSACAVAESTADVALHTVPMHEWRTLASRARLFVMHSLVRPPPHSCVLAQNTHVAHFADNRLSFVVHSLPSGTCVAAAG